jgi:hypothetical protein
LDEIAENELNFNKDFYLHHLRLIEQKIKKSIFVSDFKLFRDKQHFNDSICKAFESSKEIDGRSWRMALIEWLKIFHCIYNKVLIEIQLLDFS